MSYSFSFVAATVAAAMVAIANELDKVVEAQPVHERDREQAIVAAHSMLDLLGDAPEGQEIAGSVCGWVQRRVDDDEEVLTGVSVSVNASHRPQSG